MFETIVISTDGSDSVQRAVEVSLDLADRFDVTVHCLYVVDTSDIEKSPVELRDEMETDLVSRGQQVVTDIEQATHQPVETAIQYGEPAQAITEYAVSVDADCIAMGTRGRHGENRFLIGSVAEEVVRSAEQPVLTVRQLADDETGMSL